MRQFFDTNVLVYAYDADAIKREIARTRVQDATAEDGFVISTQVLAEFYSTTTRRRLLAPVDAFDLVSLWSDHDTVLSTPDLILRAIALHQEHSVAFWDALIIQAAIDARCDILLSEDLQHGRHFGAVEICSPFVTGAHEPRKTARRQR
jgi:predicted nucleic acid-binding protein